MLSLLFLAAVNCADLPNQLWLQIGDTQEPLIKYLGNALRKSAVAPATLVYVTSGSCTNIDAFYNKTPITVTPHYIPDSSQVPGWTPDQPAPTCTNTAAGHSIDVANSALFVSACNPNTPPADVTLTQGPVQGYTMIVPRASSQSAITAEEAYFVFGFGNQGRDASWNNEAQMFIRPITKSTLLTWAANIHVPGNKWKGQQEDSSTQVLNAVAQSSAPEQTIGILGAEIYDANRRAVKALAFQGYDQHHAWYPDASDQTFDKQNIRDGHYLPWAPTVWMQHVDPNTKQAIDPRTQYLINLILSKAQTPAFDANTLDIVIARGLVPDCAMKVTRTQEGGDLSIYLPPEPCGCYFDSKVAATTCSQCTSDASCAGGKCRNNYCEAR